MLYSQTPGTFRERTETCNSYNSTFFLDWAICNMQMALITIQLILCVIYDLNLCYNSWQTYQLLQISINEWVLWQRQFQNWVIAKQSCICLKNKMKQKKTNSADVWCWTQSKLGGLQTRVLCLMYKVLCERALYLSLFFHGNKIQWLWILAYDNVELTSGSACKSKAV